MLETDVCVRIQNIFKNDVTGDIYEPEKREDFKSVTLLYGLPVAEHPMFIMERSEVEFE